LEAFEARPPRKFWEAAQDSGTREWSAVRRDGAERPEGLTHRPSESEVRVTLQARRASRAMPRTNRRNVHLSDFRRRRTGTWATAGSRTCRKTSRCPDSPCHTPSSACDSPRASERRRPSCITETRIKTVSREIPLKRRRRRDPLWAGSVRAKRAATIAGFSVMTTP